VKARGKAVQAKVKGATAQQSDQRCSFQDVSKRARGHPPREAKQGLASERVGAQAPPKYPNNWINWQKQYFSLVTLTLMQFMVRVYLTGCAA